MSSRGGCSPPSTGMMLEVLAAVARKDYEHRRCRQAQGVAEAKLAGKYRGKRAAPPTMVSWAYCARACRVRDTAGHALLARRYREGGPPPHTATSVSAAIGIP